MKLALIYSTLLAVAGSASLAHPPLPEIYTRKPKEFKKISGDNIIVELMYTKPSIFGKQLYPANAEAYLHSQALTQLRSAANNAKQLGYTLVVLDAYRPFLQTVLMWNHAVIAKMDMNIVAPPWVGSDHNRGIAVDVTLRKGGKTIIPNPADDLNWKTCEEIKLLRNIMCDAGYEVYDKEWWHFSLPYKENFRIYNFKL